MKKILDLRNKFIVSSLIFGRRCYAVAVDLKSCQKNAKMALVCMGNSAEDFLNGTVYIRKMGSALSFSRRPVDIFLGPFLHKYPILLPRLLTGSPLLALI